MVYKEMSEANWKQHSQSKKTNFVDNRCKSQEYYVVLTFVKLAVLAGG